MNVPNWTYHDLAGRLQVGVKTVSAWVCALERGGVLAPFRPTNNTVRLTDAEVQIILSMRRQLQCVTRPTGGKVYQLRVNK